ncbi:MAG: asparagine synthase (glutamine-hydrolyzing) [Desulfovibrionaceae bacterium]|nr:asparagine synthase (glutamine-hydrolyzing) [Desulfovibrionaceae bacterium]
MCGFFGWLKAGGDLSGPELDQAVRAAQSLAHRGPDGRGEWRAPGLFMGHRRLKIIDLSDAAAQPFVSADGRHVLSYNGEIYNYIELRSELERQGVGFRTSSDTEVFLAAFSNWGPAAFSRFDGMFAAAIHDTTTGVHWLTRDPLGQKPLYYCVGDQGLVYASELRALAGLEGFGWRLDRRALLRFLTTGYYAWEDTPIKGLRKLLPGCWLEFSGRGARIERYFDSRPGQEVLDIGPQEAVAETERLVVRSCELSLRSDVPCGVFLSGGVDSSLIASICRELDPDLAAFSVAMEEPDYDESAKARAVAGQLGLRRHRVYSLGADTVRECFEDYLSFLDEPQADPGYVNALFLSRACRDEITVALAGDGGDEMFGGYLPFKGLAFEPWLRPLPGPVLALMRAVCGRLLPGSDTYLGLQFKALSYLQGFPAPLAARFPLWLAAMVPEGLKRLCPWADEGFLERSGAAGTVFDFAARLMDEMAGASLQQKLLYFYQKTFLPEFVCMHTDRASMRHGLEARSPYLSVPLVRFANRLPDKIRISRGRLKWPLKALLARRGFSKDISAQAKRGFTFPVARWLKTVLRPYAEEAFRDEALAGLVDRGELERIWSAHCAGRRNAYRIILNLISVRAFRRRYPSID